MPRGYSKLINCFISNQNFDFSRFLSNFAWNFRIAISMWKFWFFFFSIKNSNIFCSNWKRLSFFQICCVHTAHFILYERIMQHNTKIAAIKKNIQKWAINYRWSNNYEWLIIDIYCLGLLNVCRLKLCEKPKPLMLQYRPSESVIQMGFIQLHLMKNYLIGTEWLPLKIYF